MSVDQSVAEQTLLSLASRTMVQLRELARQRRLGGSYSAMSRSQLLDALQQLLGSEAQPAPAPAGAPGLQPEHAKADAPVTAAMPAPAPESPSWVSVLPRDPQWASVLWHLGGADSQRARAAGAQQLCLRLADVTGLSDGASHPHTLQEVVVDDGATAWYLPVPLSDRDYRVELGYRLAGSGWLSLAFSAVARVPADTPASGFNAGFAPFSIDPVPAHQAEMPVPVRSGGVDHERFYQQAMAASPRRLRVGSEAFHDHTQGLEDNGGQPTQASGAGVWASGRSASGSGLARARSFWLVADAELIVYGATEPSATLTIGDRQVPLQADGTFHLHVPFADGDQAYPVRAVAADGEQERSIRLEVQRQTPEARVNSREQAQLEWF
ncbi:MAG: DUF4912 domain-containing protein [Cyanobium sp. M30B3]|nr:MAG: DUF4912 domain-containing protein [Cyanobium sp. M30B3]